jgi:F-type H+-transporting ATPase subunit gamma
MATLRDIQRRIRAVKNTRQITSAMKMVSAAKLRRAQTRMMDLRPYADKMGEVISSLSAGADMDVNPLLAKRTPKVVEILVVTSDRGLCGAFNTNILKASRTLMDQFEKEEAETLEGGPPKVNISVVGKKAVDYFKRREIELQNKWVGISGGIRYLHAKEMAENIIERYLNEEIDGVHIVYNTFKNVVTQEVTTAQLLPIEPPEAPASEEGAPEADFIYEPSEQALFDALLPKNIEIQIYRALLESQASEEAARMTAMENATKSANEMIDTLTLKYNKARQAVITAELMDIVGGVEALKD